MSKYTKGPWHLDMRSYSDMRINQNADPDICICMLPIWKDEHRTEEIANARLIAAVPGLLEAAKDLLRWATKALDIGEDLRKDSMGGNSYANALEAEIAKAEGGE